MKVFISWSGEKSKAVAELLKEWLKCVLQACDPWISEEEDDRGLFWLSETSGALSEDTYGILCLTNENIEKPWIMFEAGVLSKQLSENSICAFLVDIEPKDVVQPLSLFNHTQPSKESILKLVTTLNNRLEDNKLEFNILKKVFNTFWIQFHGRYQKINEMYSDVKKNRSEDTKDNREILEEVLASVRNMGKKIVDLEEEPNEQNETNYPEQERLSADNRDTKKINTVLNMLESGMRDDNVLVFTKSRFNIEEDEASYLLREAKSLHVNKMNKKVN